MNIFTDIIFQVGTENFRVVLIKNIGSFGRYEEPRQQTLALIEVSNEDGEIIAEGSGGSFLMPTDIYDEDKGIKNAVTTAISDLNEDFKSDHQPPLNKAERKLFWDQFFLYLAGYRAQVANAAYAKLLAKAQPPLVAEPTKVEVTYNQQVGRVKWRIKPGFMGMVCPIEDCEWCKEKHQYDPACNCDTCIPF